MAYDSTSGGMLVASNRFAARGHARAPDEVLASEGMNAGQGEYNRIIEESVD
jgi:hypothetical protein